MRRQSLLAPPVTTTTSLLTVNVRQAPPTPQDVFSKPSTIEAKICLLGSAGVGKTSLLNRFLDPECSMNNVTSTVGASFRTKTIYDADTRTTLRLQIWDTAGQERFRAISRIYYRGAHAVILCYDVTDKKSWEEMKEWLGEMRANCDFSFNPTQPGGGIVVHLVGTKLDIVNHDPVKRQNSFEDTISFFAEQVASPTFSSKDSSPPLTMRPGNLTSAVIMQTPDADSKRSSGFWTQDLGWDSCHEVSAHDNDGIEEVFRVISKKLIEQKSKRDAFEANELSNAGDYFSQGASRPGSAANTGSFRLGHGRRKSWLGLPGVTAGLGSAHDDETNVFTTDPEEAKQRGRCC